MKKAHAVRSVLYHSHELMTFRQIYDMLPDYSKEGLMKSLAYLLDIGHVKKIPDLLDTRKSLYYYIQEEEE